MNPFGVELTKIEMIQTAIALVVVVASLVAILYSIWGGFLLITSGGNEEKVKPAVNHIRHSFLGLIILLIILFVSPKVIGFFGLPYADDIRPAKIFEKMQDLSGKLGGTPIEPSGEVLDSGDQGLPDDFSDL